MAPRLMTLLNLSYDETYAQDMTLNKAVYNSRAFDSPINADDSFAVETVKSQHSFPSVSKLIYSYKQIGEPPIFSWACVGGTCEETSNPAPYTSKAACLNALVANTFTTGGQCPTSYTVTYRLYTTDMNGVEIMNPTYDEVINNVIGAIYGTNTIVKNWTGAHGFDNISYYLVTANGLINAGGSANVGLGLNIISARMAIVSVIRNDGQPDNCGNPPLNCPTTNPTVVWQCNSGVCSPTLTTTTTSGTQYATKAACTSALVAPPYTGGQCAVTYLVTVQRFVTKMTGGEGDYGTNTYNLTGAITGVGFHQTGVNVDGKIYEWFILAQGGVQVQGVGSIGDSGTNLIVSGRTVLLSVVRQDALADNCGNLPSTCPV